MNYYLKTKKQDLYRFPYQMNIMSTINVKASALKESSFRRDKLFLIKFLIFVCITLYVMKGWATFVIGPHQIRSLDGDWPSTKLKTRHFLVLQVSWNWTNSIFSRINRFDLKSFLFCRATHALRFYTLSAAGGLQESFLVRFEGVYLYIFIPVRTSKFSQKLVHLSKRIPVPPNFCIYQTS